MISAAAFIGIGVVTLVGHLDAHGVLDPDTIRWIVGSLLIEWLAYEVYSTRQKLDRVTHKLDRANRMWEMIS